MDYNEETGTVVIFSKKQKLDTIAKKIAGLSGKQIYEFFSERGVKVPRKLHLAALYSVLNNLVLGLKSNSLAKEAFQRLEYYFAFSEVNLLILANQLFSAEDFLLYRMNLAKLIIINNVGLNLNDGEVNYLLTIRKTAMEDFSSYSNYISSMSYEMEDTFDGQDKNIFFDNLEVSTSVKSMLSIGEKYGIPVPSRLKKEEYIHYLVVSLKIKEASKQEELNNMTTKELEAFALANKLEMHMNMSKKEVIHYFLFTIKQFQMPQTSLKRVIIPNDFSPIRVTVDLDKVNVFDKGEGEEVVTLYDPMLEKQKEEARLKEEEEKRLALEAARKALEEEIERAEALEKQKEEERILMLERKKQEAIEKAKADEEARLKAIEDEKLAIEKAKEEERLRLIEEERIQKENEEKEKQRLIALEEAKALELKEKEAKEKADREALEEASRIALQKKEARRKRGAIIAKICYGVIIVVILALIAGIIYIMTK